MNHSIHNLASMPINAASINTSFNIKKQQQHQLLMQHHTLQHNNNQQQQQQQQQQQPLVNNNQSNLIQNLNNNTINNHLNQQQQQQQMLQFHHQTLHHPYSTLHTTTTNSNNNSTSINNLTSQLTNHNHHHNHSNSSSGGNSSTTTTIGNLHSNNNSQSMHFNNQQQHLLNQLNNNKNASQLQQQQHHQPQYYMNSSDYSSSTYHIYDQISDLIIIKQQRMERKRQQEHKRKVILLSLAAILLVGTLLFLLIQSLFASTTTTSSSSSSSSSSLNNFSSSSNQDYQPSSNVAIGSIFVSQQPTQPTQIGVGKWPPKGAPPMISPSRFLTPPIIQLPNNNNNNNDDDPISPISISQPSQSTHSIINQLPNNGNRWPSIVMPQQPIQSMSIPNRFLPPPIVQLPNSNNNEPISSISMPPPYLPSSSVSVNKWPPSIVEPPTGASNRHLQPPIVTPQIPSVNNIKRISKNPIVSPAVDDCSKLVERQCDDGIDNDKDGLVDCADSECCSDKFCQNSTLCMKSPDPLDILMRKQPPPPTSSFFQRMQFLIEKSSSQKYSNPKDFNDSRASVIRGRVTYLKQGVTGVRVSVAGQINLGITLTRDGGYFDLMVNGGGSVVIELRREPFLTKQKTVRVPWNEIVLIDQIELKLDSSAAATASIDQACLNSIASSVAEIEHTAQPSCSIHNYRLMRPYIVTAPKSSKKSHSSLKQTNSKSSIATTTTNSRAIILRESGMVQQSIVLPASSQAQILTTSNDLNANNNNNNQMNESVSLVYISSRANEFMSTINIQLVPQTTIENPIQLPDELKFIHLKIIIEGNLFEQLFEPQLNLTYTYAWNRRNVYRQKSFGLSTALVSIGYEYFDCKHIIWTTKQIYLPGHDLSISDIGQQWNLNIHHRYNYRDSILQRGDGQNFNLKLDKPKVVQQLAGDGYPRQAICSYCDGALILTEQRLLRPQSLISAPDGSLYVGDFNLIRKIEFIDNNNNNNNNKASASSTSANLATSTSGSGASATATIGNNNKINSISSEISSSSRRQIVTKTILELPATRVPSKYSLALNSAENKLYMTDIDRFQIYQIKEQQQQQRNQIFDNNDSNINNNNSSLLISDENLISIVGNGQKCQLESDRSNCGDGQLARLAQLIEPKAIVFDLNDRMYIADGPNIRMVDNNDKKIYTILGDYYTRQATTTTNSGRFPCNGESAIPMHKFIPKDPKDLALNPIDDTLHILDDNVVYRITPDKRVQIVAGRLAHCHSQQQQQQQQLLSSNFDLLDKNSRKLKASEVYLQSAQSITFNQNGDLFISEDDQKQMLGRILIVSPEEDTISIYAGQPIDSSILKSANVNNNNNNNNNNTPLLLPTVDFNYYIDLLQENNYFDSDGLNNSQQQQQQQQQQSRSSNVLQPTLTLSQLTKALDYKFNSISAITVDQQGKLIVADEMQLRILSIEPDLPQINSNGEYELQSPDNNDELLIFNRFGHHISTKEISSSRQTNNNKFTFQYNVNTSFGQLATVNYLNGNKISIYREGPHHNVKMIETAFGGQCKLDINKNGQIHSILTISPNSTKTNLSYHVDGGLLKQSRDQASGELFDFQYDEFGHAIGILHSSPKLTSPVDCHLNQMLLLSNQKRNSDFSIDSSSADCSELIVAE